MGLDMYLNAKRYLSDYRDADAPAKDAILQQFPELNAYLEEESEANPVTGVVARVGYWRKANQIHSWFVQNVQNGEDDCKSYYVGREQLQELKTLCERVLADNSLAKELLEPKDGFFFGSLDYDEYYFSDLRQTVEIVNKALSLPDSWYFEYHASW